MKKTLRPLILTLGILVSTGISSTVFAADCNTPNYKVVNAKDCSTINCTVNPEKSLKEICAKYGVDASKCLTAKECSAVKPEETSPCNTTPAKATPAKATPAKATPAKATPAKATPAKATPAKTTAPAANLTENNKLENEVITLVNQERAKLGLAPLKANSALSNVARTKSEDMRDNNYFSHTSPTYGSPFDMMKKFGITYTAAGENIAMGQPTAASVMKGWMNSPGHKANILSANFTEIGVGVAKDASGTIYWTQQFIGK
ncbi:CAP domain-containing protein [Clostridium bowmanii]|uniref:CAP domain-containing protein n=1 Tax=Clostridium bowmanii TaxID=132925 RepID=UPI001C0E2298|nr:CAP domain-containing protein [Clostridium bowmanii]MBU3189059.1 serine protease [Clostridium bowmanii]MCA1073839.1 CAP domain-containing protein [Clostridium bowmanii]